MFVDQAEQAGKAGNWAAAELIWRAIRTHIPQYWPSYTGGADALRHLGRLDEARQLLDQGAALFSWERAFPLELGRLAMIQGDWCAAETYWRTALTFDIRPWWVYTELAGALEHQGRLEDADAVLQEARLRADERDEITLFIYPAHLASKRGDWTVAVARWAEARRQFPSVMELRDRHQEALARLAEHDPAAYQAALRGIETTS
jgi:Flp pilus assembly protein TadD